jgi:hypothetical protein
VSQNTGQREVGERHGNPTGNAAPAAGAPTPRRRPGWQWALLALFLGALAIVQFIPA